MAYLRAALSYLAFVVALPVLIAHPKLRRGYRQRLGFYRAREIPALPGSRVWMHGASAGDVLALLPTVRALRQHRPDVQVTISTTTNSGRAMADRNRDAFAAVVYQPYDIPGSVHRALERMRPDVLVLEYTELWPQLIQAAARRGTRLVLHNGRFSNRRLYRYRWLFRLTGDLLNRFDALLMRDEVGAESARELGARPDSVVVSGNTKFDNLAPAVDEGKLGALSSAIAFPDDVLVLVAGSAHDAEMEPILEMFQRLRESHALRLLIAPRYVDRAPRIEQLCDRLNLSHRKRSSGPGADTAVVILDTIGELATAYALGDVAFVGGSFTDRGGQNILEPAVHGRPVVFGPHMENFADSVTLLLGRGGVQATNWEQLERVLDDLLTRGEYRQELGTLARDMVARVSGAAERNATTIAELLANPV